MPPVRCGRATGGPDARAAGEGRNARVTTRWADAHLARTADPDSTSRSNDFGPLDRDCGSHHGRGAITLALLTSQNSKVEPVAVGTITLGLNPASTLVSLAAMVPGDSVSATLTVQNTGTGTFRYAMTSSASDPDSKHLAQALTLVVERRTGCSGAVLETLYGGSVASAALGNPNPGANAGDRQLGPSTSEVLCFTVSLPTGSDTAYSSALTAWTLTMWAEQTANNP